MQAEQWQKIEEIFNEAVVMPEDQRDEFIAEQSAGDIELKDEVLSLIAEADRTDNFLDDSIIDVGNELIKKELRMALVQMDFNMRSLQNHFEIDT